MNCPRDPTSTRDISSAVRHAWPFVDLFWQELGIPGHFPQMLVGILKVASIATPEGLFGRRNDLHDRFLTICLCIGVVVGDL